MIWSFPLLCNEQLSWNFLVSNKSHFFSFGEISKALQTTGVISRHIWMISFASVKNVFAWISLQLRWNEAIRWIIVTARTSRNEFIPEKREMNERSRILFNDVLNCFAISHSSSHKLFRLDAFRVCDAVRTKTGKWLLYVWLKTISKANSRRIKSERIKSGSVDDLIKHELITFNWWMFFNAFQGNNAKKTKDCQGVVCTCFVSWAAFVLWIIYLQ